MVSGNRHHTLNQKLHLTVESKILYSNFCQTAVIHRLRRDNPSMLIAHHQDAGIDPFGKPFVEVRFVNRLLGLDSTVKCNF